MLMKLSPLDVAIILSYFAVVLGTGYYLKGRIHTSSDFLLTDRSLSHWITGIAFMGEGAGLSEAELSEAVRIVREAVDDKLPVLAGIIADSSAEAVRLARAARDAGACGLQVPPPHFRPSSDTSILEQYYRAITGGSGLPLIIYNVIPTAEAAVDSLQEIMDANPGVVGVKQSARNMT